MESTFFWYSQLIKPSWAPPAWLFGPVWTLLYAQIAVSFGAVFVLAARKKIPLVCALPFALNLGFNLAFTPIQFGLQNNALATFDILLVLGTLLWGMVVIYPRRHWIAYMQVPYLFWVAFATVLQVTITILNW